MPVNRGILTTIYTDLGGDVVAFNPTTVFETAYGQEPFVRLLGNERLPDTKNVVGTNFIDIAWKIDNRTSRLIVMSAIDNLTKGTSGQAGAMFQSHVRSSRNRRFDLKNSFRKIAGSICAPRGFKCAAVFCDIKKLGTGKGSEKGKKRDLALIVSDVPAAVAGMFTTNQVCAAPVKVSAKRAAQKTARAIVANSGNANACTGKLGLRRCRTR